RGRQQDQREPSRHGQDDATRARRGAPRVGSTLPREPVDAPQRTTEVDGMPNGDARTWAGAGAGMPPPPGFPSGGSWPPVPPSHDPGRRRAAFLIATVLIASSVFGAWQLAREASDSASPSSPAASGQVEGDRSAGAI